MAAAAAAAVRMASWVVLLVLVVALMAGPASQQNLAGHGGEELDVAAFSQCCVQILGLTWLFESATAWCNVCTSGCLKAA
jgi:hypothetical protein